MVETPIGERKLFQIVWDVANESTLQREMRALRAAEKELNIKGELITAEVYIKHYWENNSDSNRT